MTDKLFSKRMRINILKMISKAKASHIAAAFSCTDILAVLYNRILREEKHDVFILSKGHAGSAVYAALFEKGYIGQADIDSYYLDGSLLSGHVSHVGMDKIEFSTGSLGHGVCVACGMAVADKLDGRDSHIYALVGDGECEEGSVWETALLARHYRLDNFTVIVDRNKYQAITTCDETISLGDLGGKWRAFGWETVEIDGHDHASVAAALLKRKKDKPVCIIAHTVKGKGVSFMENNMLWHYRDPQNEFFANALAELEAQ
ncbi:transketolase [Clostridia bacterium]|nr:transketolase [Clostridia bacterium]